MVSPSPPPGPSPGTETFVRVWNSTITIHSFDLKTIFDLLFCSFSILLLIRFLVNLKKDCMPALTRQTIQKHLKKSIISSLTPSNFSSHPWEKQHWLSVLCLATIFLKAQNTCTNMYTYLEGFFFFAAELWIILCTLPWQLTFYFSLITPEVPADIWLDQLIFLHSCIIFHSWGQNHESNHSPADWYPGCVQGICVCMLSTSNDVPINMLMLL